MRLFAFCAALSCWLMGCGNAGMDIARHGRRLTDFAHHIFKLVPSGSIVAAGMSSMRWRSACHTLVHAAGALGWGAACQLGLGATTRQVEPIANASP